MTVSQNKFRLGGIMNDFSEWKLNRHVVCLYISCRKKKNKSFLKFLMDLHTKKKKSPVRTISGGPLELGLCATNEVERRGGL